MEDKETRQEEKAKEAIEATEPESDQVLSEDDLEKVAGGSPDMTHLDNIH